MCRFIIYISSNPILIAKLIYNNNCLEKQCIDAQHGKQLNIDGSGLAWYSENSSGAAIIKSILPLHNDQNIKSIAHHVQSMCFIGHIRAATYGNISTNNCQPFTYRNYTFCHNGNIDNYQNSKQSLEQLISNHDHFSEGSTDSELIFFALPISS